MNQTLDHAAACVRAVDETLLAFIDGLALPERLHEPVRYALLGGGKRIRPLLAWLSCMAVGADPRASLGAGCAIELVHAFSLVHDDLPCIDNDDMRRGRPSLHVHAGEAGAVLGGDAMLALAFHLLTRDRLDGALCAALCAELAEATTAMIAGQVIDVEGSAALRDVHRLAEMHAMKTGALITASCRMGALCGIHACGRSPGTEFDGITAFGRAIGLMFQIVDDLLDVEQASDAIGKPAGSDRAAGKRTYPDLIGIPRCRDEIARLRLEALSSIECLGAPAAALRDLVDQLASRTR